MLKKIITLICITSALILAVFILTNRPSPSGQTLGARKGAEKFRISINTWIGYGPLWLAKDKDFFEEQGLDVEISIIEDSFQRKTAIINESIDGLGDTVDMIALARAQGVPSVAVMQMDVSNGADGILTTTDIKSVQDLKGKQIAVQKNFISEAFLNYILKKNNIALKDVELVDMEASAAGAAFLAGKVNVAVTFEPWMSKVKSKKNGKILLSSKDADGILVDVLSVHEEYLKNNPENVKKLIIGWYKAVDYMEKNQTEAFEIIAKHYGVSATEFKELSLGVLWPKLSDSKKYFGTKEKPGQIYDVADTFGNIFMETGQISKKPEADKLINSSLLYEISDPYNK